MTNKVTTRRAWKTTFGAIALAAYLFLLFSHSPILLSLTIHRSAIHYLHRYERQHAIQVHFDSEDFKQLNWTKPNKEFEWRGDMYDVIELQEDSCGQMVTCFKDVLETKMLRLIRNTARRVREQFSSFIHAVHLFCEPAPKLEVQLPVAGRQLLPDVPQHYSPAFPEPTAPPPDA